MGVLPRGRFIRISSGVHLARRAWPFCFGIGTRCGICPRSWWISCPLDQASLVSTRIFILHLTAVTWLLYCSRGKHTNGATKVASRASRRLHLQSEYLPRLPWKSAGQDRERTTEGRLVARAWSALTATSSERRMTLSRYCWTPACYSVIRLLTLQFFHGDVVSRKAEPSYRGKVIVS